MSNEISKDKPVEENDKQSYFIPKVDISYNDEETIILADMPGVDNQGVEVSLKDDDLTITGKNSINIPKGFDLRWQEYKLGNYRKSFKMTDSIDSQNVSAIMKDGVLKLTLPNKKQSIPIKVKVKAG